MRRVVAYELLSLDGVAEAPDRFFTTWDEAMAANLASVIGTQDMVILGRRSYDEWAEFWPESDIEPFASFINGVTKYVATSTPLDRDWAHATAVDGELVDFVRAAAGLTGGDIGIHASISVTQTLLAAGLVDELRLVIAPTIAGSGRRLLDGLPAIKFEVTRSSLSPTGHLLVDYRVIRPHIPVTYENCDHIKGPFFHGTKSALKVGDELVAGYGSNFQVGRVSNNIYFTSIVETAAWGAELATALAGLDDPGHIYIVEPLGPFEDDPNVTNKKFSGNPTESYRTRHPLRVVGELETWDGHDPAIIQRMVANVARLREQGLDLIDD